MSSSLSIEASSSQINVFGQTKTAINSTFDEYRFEVSCYPLLSGQFTLSINVVSTACPALKFSWAKTCGTGAPIPKRGLAITHLKEDNRFIVKDGVVVEKNYMQLPAEDKQAIGEHHAQLSMFLHLLPVSKSSPNADMTLSTARTVQHLPNFQDLVHLTTQ